MYFRHRRRLAARLTARLRRDDSGFTLGEVVIAMLLLSILIVILTGALGAGLAASRGAKQFQQATALANGAVEDARNAGFAELAMVYSDLVPATDPRIRTTSADCETPNPGLEGDRFLDPDDEGPLKCEAIHWVLTGGAIAPHVTTEVLGGLTYTIRRYVTWVDAKTVPDDPDASQGGSRKDYKRVVSIVEWEVSGTLRTYKASTLVTDVRRGSNVATFVLTPSSQGKRVQTGNKVVFAHTIHNFGNTDTYDLRWQEGTEAPNPRGWAQKFHNDANKNGDLDEGEPLLTDTNACSSLPPGAACDDTGAVDTGPIPEGRIAFFLVVWDLATADAPGRESTKVTATSTLDGELYETATDTVQVETLPIMLDLYLHNRPTAPTAPSTAQVWLEMSDRLPTDTTLHPYSTDIIADRPGRVVKKGGNVNTSPDAPGIPDKVVNWTTTLSGRTTFKGTATLDVFPVDTALACVGGRFEVHLAHMTSTRTNRTPIHTALASSPTCIQRVEFPVDPGPIAGGRAVELKITVPSGGTSVDLTFAYDTASFAAILRLPRVSAPL